MAPTRSRSRFPLRGSRRKTSWDEGTGRQAPTTISGTGITALNLAAEFLRDGLTVVRQHGELMMYLESASAARDGYAGAFGVGIAEAKAIAVGVTALPGPIAEMDWDGWLIHRIFSIRTPAVLVGAASEDVDALLPVTGAVRFEIDSKSMRKVGIGDTLFAVIEVTEVGTAVMQVNWNSRVLVKLP